MASEKAHCSASCGGPDAAGRLQTAPLLAILCADVRIGFLANPDGANGWYRGILPMSALHERGHQVRPLSLKPAAWKNQVTDLDVLHVHRYDAPEVLRLMAEVKRRGTTVVWDNDDDYATIPEGTLAHRRHGGLRWQRRLAGWKRLFSLVDLVTAPSAVLTERLRGFGARETAVIENFIPDMFLKRTPRTEHAGTLTIGWVAGVEHQIDAERLHIASTLQRVLDERPDVSITTIGLHLPLSSDRYRHIEKVHLLAPGGHSATLEQGGERVQLAKVSPGGLANYIATFDIAIAPLSDIPFNHARSNIKLKEYAAGGAPWLASPTGPYAGMSDEQGGHLVQDDGWHEAIVHLLDKPRTRRKLAKRGARWASSQTVSAHAALWEEALEHAANGRSLR